MWSKSNRNSGSPSRWNSNAYRAFACLASMAIGCGGSDPPCESGRYDFCYETFPAAVDAITAENPETMVSFVMEDGGEEVLIWLDVPDTADPGVLPVAFHADQPHVEMQLSVGDDTFWGASGRVTLERHDGERIVGSGRDLVLDESLRDPEDGDRLAYVGGLEFDIEIEHQGD